MAHFLKYGAFHIHQHQQHLKWSSKIAPTLTITSGQIVTFDTIDGSNGQLNAMSTKADLANFNVDLADPAMGPVFVQGAKPGDVLRVDILAFETADWGWTAILPGFGLLADEFPEPELNIWKLEPDQGTARFKEGVHIPLQPFLGVMGVAPAGEGSLSMIPPQNTGGNIDCRHLSVGSTLYLPVQVPGALFSCGDGHAAQGDGEVCGTAIETPLKATLRLTVCKDRPWVKSPHFEIAPRTRPLRAARPDNGQYAAMGIGADLREASRQAVRSLLDWMVNARGLTRTEAYMIASVAGDLRIVEAVDMPNYAVAMILPLNIFD